MHFHKFHPALSLKILCLVSRSRRRLDTLHIEIKTLSFFQLPKPELAKNAFEQMEQVQCCRDCEYGKCYESSYFLGKYYLAEGDKEKAISCLKEALRRNQNSLEVRRTLMKYL